MASSERIQVALRSFQVLALCIFFDSRVDALEIEHVIVDAVSYDTLGLAMTTLNL